MKRRNLLAVIVLLAAAVLSATCAIPDPAKDGENNGPTCESAMDNLYNRGCTISSNGYAVARADAINNCEDDANNASSCECDSERDDLLGCLYDLSECNDCDTEFSNYNNCMYVC